MRTSDNYCQHGTYVGGCGADYMCHYCELGYSDAEYQALLNRKARSRMAYSALVNMFTYEAARQVDHLPSMAIGMVGALSKHRN